MRPACSTTTARSWASPSLPQPEPHDEGEPWEWIADPARERDWMPLPAAQKFVAEGWAPTFVGTGADLMSGAEWIGMRED